MSRPELQRVSPPQHPVASDGGYLDALLADADEFSGWVSPQRQPQTQNLQTTDAMANLQAEATRLWKARTKLIQPEKAAFPNKKTNSWQRRKLERQQLHDEVARLETELRTKQTAIVSISTYGKEAPEERERREQRRREYLEIAWKIAAEKEERLKQAALVENEQLKQLVARHVRLSQALRSIMAESSAIDLPTQARWQNAAERSSLFNALEKKIDARLPSIRVMIRRFAASTQTRPELSNSVQMEVNDSDSARPLGNIQRSKTFPFDLTQVANMFWNYAQQGFAELTTNTRMAFPLSDDVVGLEGDVDIPRAGLVDVAAAFHISGVIKRTIVDGYILFQFACVSEWDHKGSSTMLTEESAWALARTSSSPKNNGGAHMKGMIETMFVSAKDARNPSNRTRRDLIANMAMPALGAMTTRADQIIENALLDEARTSARGQ